MDFFLGFHKLMETNLLKVIEESKSSRLVLGAVNATFLALIPKENYPRSFEYYRPISL
jgi:hypothetical protein